MATRSKPTPKQATRNRPVHRSATPLGAQDPGEPHEPERQYGGQRMTRAVHASGITGEPPDIYCYDWSPLADIDRVKSDPLGDEHLHRPR